MFDEAKLRTVHKTVTMIATAIIMGITMLTGVFYYLISTHAPVMNSPLKRIYPVMIAVGVASLAASFFVKNQILEKKEDALTQLQTAFFITFALCEAAIIPGVLIAFLAKDAHQLIIPVLLGIVGFSMHFPQYDQWEQYIKNRQGV